MNDKQLKTTLRLILGVGLLLCIASIVISWGKDATSLSSTLLWAGFVMVLIPALVGARGAKS